MLNQCGDRNEAELAEAAERGHALYEQALKTVLEPDENGHTVAIHPDTGDYLVALDWTKAWQTLRGRHADGLIMTLTIGEQTRNHHHCRMFCSEHVTHHR